MTFELFIILLMTFGLATGFKNTRLLRIPIGIFLFFIGVIVKDSMGLKEFVFFLIACALPFVFAKSDTLVNLLKKRTRRPLFFDYEKSSFARIGKDKIKDNGYSVTSTNITIHDIEFTPNWSLKVELMFSIYVRRSLFLTPIFMMSGPETGLRDFIANNLPNRFVFLAVSAAIMLFVFILEFYTLIDEGEFDKEINKLGNKLKKERRDQLREQAEKERDILIQKEAGEQREAEERKIELEKERTKQAEIEADLKRRKMEKDRPEKQEQLSKIIDKLDDL